MKKENLYAEAWGLAGLVWVTNGLLGLDAVDGTTRFYVTEAAWLPVHALVLVGLVGLRRARIVGESAWGCAGLNLALAGRVVFLVGEAVAIGLGHDESILFPVAAVSTGIGMLLAGGAVVRAQRWQGWRRLAPVAMGAYPFIFMFPILAVTGQRPNVAVSMWGLTFIAIGAAVSRGPSLLARRRSTGVSCGLPGRS